MTSLVAAGTLCGNGTASAAGPAVPVVIVTVPAIPGAHFDVSGERVVADENGIGVALAEGPGPHRVSVARSRIDLGRTTAVFMRWENAVVGAREVSIDTPGTTILHAAYRVEGTTVFRLDGYSDIRADPPTVVGIEHALGSENIPLDEPVTLPLVMAGAREREFHERAAVFSLRFLETTNGQLIDLSSAKTLAPAAGRASARISFLRRSRVSAFPAPPAVRNANLLAVLVVLNGTLLVLAGVRSRLTGRKPAVPEDPIRPPGRRYLRVILKNGNILNGWSPYAGSNRPSGVILLDIVSGYTDDGEPLEFNNSDGFIPSVDIDQVEIISPARDIRPLSREAPTDQHRRG